MVSVKHNKTINFAPMTPGIAAFVSKPMMKSPVFLIILLMISGCAANQTPEQIWLSSDTDRIERAKSLYSCAHFYDMISGQRRKQSEKEQYQKYSALARKLGWGLAPIDGDPSQQARDALKDRYLRQAEYRATQWVIAIGKDQTNTKLVDLTKSCLERINREDFLGVVDDLGSKLDSET